MILAQNWPKTAKSSWKCPFKFEEWATYTNEMMMSYTQPNIEYKWTVVSFWHENMIGYLSAHIIWCEKRTVFRERSLRKTELRGTDNVQGQISVQIFAPNGAYLVYYPSNLLRNVHSFENWGIFLETNCMQAKRWWIIIVVTLANLQCRLLKLGGLIVLQETHLWL